MNVPGYLKLCSGTFYLDGCDRFEKNFIFGYYNINCVFRIKLFSGYAPQAQYYF